jgi:hypothetical protein
MADIDIEAIQDLTGTTIGEGQVGQRFEWGDGTFFEIHVEGDKLRFDYLMAHPTGKPQTRDESAHRLAQLVATLPAFFRERGIAAFVTSRSGANDAMRAVGFEDADRQLEADIAEGGRMDQYTAWKRGGPEPEWHARLIVE